MTVDADEVWDAALDDFERTIDAQERWLDDHTPDEPAPIFAPPAGLPSPPADLAHRARSLAERSDALLARARTVSESTRPTDSTARVSRPRAASSSSTFDELA